VNVIVMSDAVAQTTSVNDGPEDSVSADGGSAGGGSMDIDAIEPIGSIDIDVGRDPVPEEPSFRDWSSITTGLTSGVGL
jgi:hypothetical protein